MDQKPTSVTDVKKFVEHGCHPVQMSEMQSFWKSLTDQEKERFRKEVSMWDGSSHFIKAA